MTLPNFLIIGAARSGTTSLYHGLRQHPEIFMPVKKEPHFFTTQYGRGLDWYEELFRDWHGEKAIGEASVSYTYPDSGDVTARIASHLEKPRFVYIMREPVSRTYSHYVYYRYYARSETRSFEAAIRENPRYLGASDYVRWIAEYRSAFGASRLKLVLYDDLRDAPERCYREIFEFLGVDSGFVPEGSDKRTNQAFRARSEVLYSVYRKVSRSPARRTLEKAIPEVWRPRIRNAVRKVLGGSEIPKIDPAIRSELAARLAPQVRALEEILERSLDAWHPSELRT